MKTSRSLSAFFGLLAILVSSPAKAEYPLISSTSVPGAVSGSLVNRLVQNPATGDLYAAGSLAAGAGNLNIWVARYSPALVLLSSFTYDKAGFNDAALGVAVDTLTSDVYVTGYVSSGAAQSSRDVWLARFDSTLVLQSSITVDGSASDRDEGTSLSVSSGAVYVVGISSQPGGKGIWLANYAANFVLISSGNYYQNNCEVSDFLRTAGGTFVVGGRAPNFLVSNDAWIGKFDASHVFLASAAYNGPASQTDHLHALAEDGAGGVFAVGFVYSATMADQYIAHFDSSLVRTASTTVNGPNNNNDSLTSVVRTASGTLLVSGSYSAVAGLGGINFYLAEYDSALNKLSSTSYASSGSGADASYAVLVGANQDVYAAGYAANAGSQDMWLGRFSTSPASVSYPGCATTHNVGSGQTYATIQSAVDALPSILAGPSCVVIRDGATYAEQVTVRNFTNNGSSITILADPASGLRPAVAPPAASTAAFVIANASVNIYGIDVVGANAMNWGVLASSAQISLSSVNVRDPSGLIAFAGISISSNDSVAYSSIAVLNAHGLQVNGSNCVVHSSTMINLSNTGGVTLFYALHLNSASGNVFSNLYVKNAAENSVCTNFFSAYLSFSNNNSFSNSIFANNTPSLNKCNGALGLEQSSTNTFTLMTYSGGSNGIDLFAGNASNYNRFTNSTVTANGPSSALNTNGGIYNDFSGFRIEQLHPGGIAVDFGGVGNTISSSTILKNGPTWGAVVPNQNLASPFNSISHSFIGNPGGYGIDAFSSTTGIYPNSLIVSFSTITSAAAGYAAVLLNYSSAVLISNSYLQGASAARLVGSTGTVITSSVLIATSAAGAGLSLTGGNSGLTISFSTLSAPTSGQSVELTKDNSGSLSFSNLAIIGGSFGLHIATQAAGANIAVSSVTFRNLTPGATAIFFTGGTVVSTFTAVRFEDDSISVNVGAASLTPTSRITMSASSGTRTGAAYENDPNSLVDWPIFVAAPFVPAGLGASGVGLGAATLSWASGGNSTGTVYELERSTGAGFGLRLSSTALSFLDLTLSPASTYYYRVRAFNAELVASAYSSTLAVVSPPVSVRPAIVSVTPSAAATGALLPAAVVGTGFEAPAALSLERAPAGSGVWTATGSFTTARFGSALVKLRDGRALLIGGQVEGSGAGRPQVDLFNLSSGAWTAAAPLNVGRLELAAVMLADGRVLVTGGQAPDGSVGDTAEIYDPTTGAWTLVAPMSQVRKGHRLALLPDGRVLAAGGASAPVTAVLTAEIYDPALNAWSAAASMSALRAFPTLTVLGNGKVLVAGGRDPTAKSASAQLYDPVANTWTETAPMSIGRSDHEAVVLPDGRVLIAGGLDTVGESASGDVYDPATSSWTATGPMAAQRRSAALALVDGEPLAIGGQSSSTDFASTEIYDAATNAWRAGPSLTGTRTLTAAVVLDDGKVLVAGGRRGLGGGTNLNTAERLDGPGASIAATGVSVPDAQHLNGTVSLAGAATGYWDVVVRDPAGRVGRLSGGVLVALPVAAPSGFAGSALSTSSILWSWADNSPNETGYRVMAGVVNVSGDLAAGATTWLQAGLGVNAPSGTLFARGFNAGGSADSAPAARYSLAAAPENLAATVFLTSAAVTWTSGNPAGTFFALERSTGGVFSLTASTTLASWVDTGLGAGTTYYYRVRAFNADAVATAYASSAAARTAVAAVPDAPSAFAGAAQSTTSILWSWTDNSDDEAGFRVKAGGTDLSGALPAGTTAWLQTGLGVNASAGAMFAQAFNSTGTADSGSLARYSLAAAPFGLASADVFQTSATVSWTAGNPAGTIFELERSSGAGFVPAVSTASASYTDTGLAEASTYTYRVRALNGDSTATAYASTIAFTTRPMPPPAAPAGFAGAAQSPVSILWSWTDAASTEAGYRVLSGAVGISSDLAAGATAWLQAGLSTNTAYGPFAAQAFNAGGTVNSAAASRYTLAAPPTGGAAASITSTTMVASWSLAGNPPATIAALERSLDAVVYSTLAAGAVTSWADADLLGCTTYYYRVRNVNGDGVATAYASFQGVTANTIPGPPSGLSASANAGGTIGLAWGFSPTEGVTGYRLYWDAGSGTVSYAAPLAVLGSTASSFTTGVLASSAAYTFALRAVHRCGVVETAGASAMSGAAIAAAEVRAAIKEPDSGRRVNGNRVTILGELVAGTPGDVQQVVFQYKLAASTGWIDVDEANVNHPNPDFSFPYFVHVDVTALAAGDYDLRAVAYNRDGVPDASPPAVRIVVDPVTPDVSETRLVDGTIKKDQTVSNAVTSVIDTAGAGASDPAVRVTIPVGAVNSTTATVSVIANPAITTAAPAGQSFVGSAIKIDLSNGQSALNGTAEITLTYPDTVLFPSLLQIYYLDEATGRWSRDFNSTVDTASRTVTGRTPHFSTFAIMLGTAFAPDLSSVRVYPVPFKPNGTNADEGRPFSIGDANSGIIFANMASGAEIRIYTLTGRLVASLDSPSIAGTVRWDARNQDGRDVASGAYFAVISAAGQKNVVKKLVIIR